MTQILVVEDERDIADVLDYNLTNAGYEVLAAACGQDGLKLARARKPDLVLLDLMLPDISGTEVCRALKDDPNTRGLPVIMVSARGEEIDRVVGFELGVEDYVTKPFSMRELLLRIKAVLRRQSPKGEVSGQFLEFGELRIDLGAHRVWVREVEVELTAIEFKLLTTLHDRQNRVQSRAALLDHVWGMDTKVTTRTVDAHVKRLRQKLGAARDYVETVRGVGYRFAEAPLAS
ncbi:MAG: response regulator [Polyangiaceae bacterium]|nr:response regulator [Polyangiaceae bacterium]